MADESAPVSIPGLAEGIAALGAVGFVISVIYDWGFARALGLDFAHLPTTTADHFRSGLLWFPPLLVMVFLYVAIEFQFQRFERGLTEKEIIESSSAPERLRRFRESPGKLMAWLAALVAVTYILIGDAFASMLPVALAIVWMGFADWCYSAPLIRLRRGKAVQLGFTFLPAIGILAYFGGYNAAVDAAVRKPVEVTIERPKPLSPISGRVLRTLEKGVLLLRTDGSIQFTPWNQVEALVRNDTYKPFRGALCDWFSLCPSVDRSSKVPMSPAAGVEVDQ